MRQKRIVCGGFGVLFQAVREYFTICLCHSYSMEVYDPKQSIFTLYFQQTLPYPHQFKIGQVNSKCTDYMEISII